MKNISISNPFKQLAQIFQSHIITLLVITVIGILSFCVLVLSDISQRPLGVSSATITDDTIDNATINRLNQLKTTSSSDNRQLPTGRINPFSE